MNTVVISCLLWKWRFEEILRGESGQDLIEYALMAGLVATGIVTMSPQIATSMGVIWSKVKSDMDLAASS